MMQETLVIEVPRCKDGTLILSLKGPILLSNFFEFQNRIRSSTQRALILDFTGVPYIDSAEIGALVGAYATHQKDGRSLALVAVNESVRNAMEVTRVGSFFRFFDSIPAAEAASA